MYCGGDFIFLSASVGGFLCIGGATLVLVAGFTGTGAGSIAIASSSALVRSAFAAYFQQVKKKETCRKQCNWSNQNIKLVKKANTH